MPRLLTLSRAARLVGVRRGVLQSKIRSGELAAFEGMVSAEDLLRAYPEAKLEDDTALERIERIKDSAFARRMRERLLPSSEVLVARLTEMGRERAKILAQVEHYRAVIDALQTKLRAPPAGRAGIAAELLDWLALRLAEAPLDARQPLMVQDSFLRIMTAHVQLKPSGHEFFVDGNDSLLDAALHAGLALEYGCSIGSCGKCKAKVLSGEVHKTRHSDYVVTAAEKAAGVVLMCCNTAVSDLVIEAHEAHGAADMPLQSIEARVKSVTQLGSDIRLLHLQTPRTNRLRFLAGQSVSLELPGVPTASRPVASCPCDDRNLQFHISRRARDEFAERVFAGLKGVDTVRIEGPRGEFVLDEESSRTPVFIAGDTGFAPVKSLLEHAMALDTADMLHLYWIASEKTGHYLDNLCRAWSDALDNFRYTPLTAAAGSSDEAAIQSTLAQVAKHHQRLDECDFYVAGPGELTNAAEYLLLDHGLPRAQLLVNTLDT